MNDLNKGKNFQIAIDGPAGSGKSTISKLVAKKLNFNYLDTGAMYRAITLEALRLNINLEDANEYDFVKTLNIEYINGNLFLNKVNVSTEIRSIDVTNNVSTVSKIALVREEMVALQKKIANNTNVVMDGRDIGYVVLPKADVKIFLTASVEERAKRRFLQHSKLTLEEIKEDLIKRDYKDSNREISPLKKADDAILLDTSHLSIDEVVVKIIDIVEEKMKMNKFNEENNNINEDDYGSFNIPRKNTVVEGVVVAVRKDRVLVDIKSITEAELTLKNYTNDESITSFVGVLNEGDTVKAVVVELEKNNDSQAIGLSCLPLLKKESQAKVYELYDNHEDIEIVVKNKVNKGFTADYKGVEIFIPETLIDLHYDENKDYLNQKIKVRLIDKKPRNLVASRKVILIEEHATLKEQELANINVDDVLEGTIIKIESYGALVKFNSVVGLVRISQISHQRVENVADVLKVDQKVKVKVLAKEKGRIDLSIKALIAHPFEAYTSNHKVSDTVTGKVLQKLPFGIVLELAKDVTALIHKNEFSWNPEDNSMAYVKVGDEVEASIISIDTEKRKISLSKRALIDNPWARVTLNVGDLVEVKVSSIVSGKGINVSVQGVEGFIDKKDLVFTEKQTKIEDAYELDSTITAVVTEFNPKMWVLKLNAKKHADDLERKQFDEYMESQTEEEETVSLGDRFENILK